MDYISVKEAAKKWQVSERFVQRRCLEGRIEGAAKFGKSWIIPWNTGKPTDMRKSKYTPNKAQDTKRNTEEKYKHDIMPLMNSVFIPGKCKEYIESIPDKDERAIAEAEFFYYTGNAAKCLKISEKYIYSEIFELRTSAIWLYSLSNLSLDRTADANKALRLVKKIYETTGENSTKLERSLAICLYNASLTQLHLLNPSEVPKTEDYMYCLPKGLRLFICYSQAYYAYTNNMHGVAIGMAETCLAISDMHYTIPYIYLHLVCAMCYIHLGHKKLSEMHLCEAVKLAKQDGLWQPFGELHKELCGMIEATIKKDASEDFRKIISLAKNYSLGWRRIYNELTGKNIPTDLTTTEYTVAMLVARGWQGKEIAAHLGITENAAQKYTSEIMSKMGVSKRSEIKKIMLPK